MSFAPDELVLARLLRAAEGILDPDIFMDDHA